MSGRAARTRPRLRAALVLFGAFLGACGGKEKPSAAAGGGDAATGRYSQDGRIDRKPTATPNVVLVVLSGVRYDLALGGGGAPAAMPALAALARKATSFTSASSPASWAAPAFASIVTGDFPDDHGVSGVRGSRPSGPVPALVLLAEALRGAGYATAGFVHASSGIRGAEALGQGCETWVEDFRLEDGVERVASWLERRPVAKPFFLMVHADDAAEPFGAKSNPPAPGARETYLRTAVEQTVASVEAHEGLVAPGDVPTLLRALLTDAVAAERVRASSIDPSRLAAAAAGAGASTVLRGPRGDELAREARERYATNLERVDGLLASLLARVDAASKPEDTVLIVCSDHGVALGEEHGAADGEARTRRFGSGGSLFEEHVHVPLVIRAPGRLSARAVPGSCGLVDVLATTLDFLGLPRPADTDGHSLLPLVQRPDAPGMPVIADDVSFVATKEGRVERRRLLAVRSARGKTLFAFDGVTTRWTETVFDLSVDPAETSPRDASAVASFGADFESAVKAVRDRLSGRSRQIREVRGLGYGGQPD